MVSILARAEAGSADVQHAKTTKALLTAAANFARFLEEVPDTGSTTRGDLTATLDLAEGVIAYVDARVDAPGESHAAKLQCATLVYRLRAALEGIDKWSRHFPP